MKTVQPDAAEQNAPKKKLSLFEKFMLGLLTGSIIFLLFGTCMLISPTLRWLSANKKEAVNHKARNLYDVCCSYQMLADGNPELPPLKTQIRKIGSADDALDMLIEEKYPEFSGKWCAVAIADETNYLPPEYVLYSEKEITSYQPMSDEEISDYYSKLFRFSGSAVGHYPPSETS